MPIISAIVAGITAVATAVGSFIAPLTAAIGGLGSVGKALLSIGLNLAMSAAQSLFAKKPAAPPSGVELDLQFGEGGSRKVMCGRFAVAGLFVYPNSFGSANANLQQAFQLSDFPVTSLDKIWIDGELATLGGIDPVKGAVVTSGDYADRIWIKLIDGWQTAADSGLVSGSNPTGRWTANHIGLGNAYVIVTMLYDREKLTQPPSFLFEGKGAPLYDWRKDTTAGGSGSHRWNDITTWEFTENPMLMAYAYHGGIAFNGDLFCGMEVPASDLPLTRWTAAANLCDEIVEGAARYRCSIGLDCNAEHGDNVEAILTSCGGMMVNGVGEVFPIVGSAQPIVATLTDDDLVVGEKVRFQARRAMGELVNSVSGTFPNPDNQWGPTSYVTARDSAVVAADRRTRDVVINFGTVPYPEQAANLASLYYSENRFEATAAIVARPRWQVLEPGDWIVWNSARYGSRTYMVVDCELKSASADGPRNAVLSLQERSADIYDGVGIVVPPVPLGPATPVYAAELQDFTVTAATGIGSDGRVYPMIRTTWSALTDPTVSGFVLEWRASAYPSEIQDRMVTIDRSMALITEGIVSQTSYEVRHRLITDPPRVTTPSAWQEVTTANAPSSDVTVTLNRVAEDLRSTLTGLRADLDEALEIQADLSVSLQLSGIANYTTISKVGERVGNAEASITVEQDVRATADTAIAAQLVTFETNLNDVSASVTAETLARSTADTALAADITSLTSTVGSNTAAITSEASTRASADSALAADITVLEASLTNAEGDISANATAIGATQASVTTLDGEVTVLASDLTVVEAKSDAGTAGGLIKWEAVSAPSGVLASFSIFGKATSGGTYRDAGARLDITSTEATWNFFSDQFRIAKPDGTPIAVFGLDGTDLLLQNIRVGTVTFDQLSSANGKLVLKGSGTNASIEVFS